MKIKHCLLSVAFLAVPLIAVAGPDAKQPLRFEPTCSWSQAAVKFKKVVIDNKGNLERLDLKEGLVVLATANQPEHVVAIRKAAKALAEDFRTFRSEGKDTPCNKVLNAAQRGKLTVQLQDTAQGIAVAYFSTDPAISKLLLSDCCDYCICPSTGWQCSKCC